MKTWVVVWIALRFEEYASEIVCGRGLTMEIWWWTPSGGRRKKEHVKHHWKEVSQEKLMRQHSTGRVRAASKMLWICSTLKKKSPIEQTSKRFQMPKETLMRNHYSFNQTHIPGIQSYPISEEKILVQC